MATELKLSDSNKKKSGKPEHTVEYHYGDTSGEIIEEKEVTAVDIPEEYCQELAEGKVSKKFISFLRENDYSEKDINEFIFQFQQECTLIDKGVEKEEEKFVPKYELDKIKN